VFDDIALLDRAIQIRLISFVETICHARFPFLRIPPLGKHPCSFGFVKVRIEVRSWMFLVVDASMLAHECVFILDAQAVGVYDVGESFVFGFVVEEAFFLDGSKGVGRTGAGATATAVLRCGSAAAFLVGLPVGFLTISGAIEVGLTFCAAF
jgi:hypothetical protein